MASKLECTQIYYIPLFVPDSIKVSCKEIIPLLQEIVALLLSVFFFFLAPIYSRAIAAFKRLLPRPSLGLLSIPAGNASIVT